MEANAMRNFAREKSMHFISFEKIGNFLQKRSFLNFSHFSHESYAKNAKFWRYKNVPEIFPITWNETVSGFNKHEVYKHLIKF